MAIPTLARAIQLATLSSVLALAACARGPDAGRSDVVAEECYALTYDDGSRADTMFFPRALTLRPGADGGPVGPGSPSTGGDPFWSLFGGGAVWDRLPSDSLAIAFSNGVSSTDLVVAHDGRALGGRAAFRFQAGSEPYPVLAVRGRRRDCD